VLPDEDGAVRMTGYAASQPDQVLVRVDADHVQVPDRDARAAHAPREALPLDDAAGIGAGADRAGLLVSGASVGGAPRREMMAAHDAREPTPFRHSDDVDFDADLEERDGERLADLVGRGILDADLAKPPKARGLVLLPVALQRLSNQLLPTLPESDLDRGVAVRLGRLQLDHRAGARRENGHRNNVSLLVVDLAHSDFLREQSDHGRPRLELDLDVHAGRQIELHQRVDRLRRRLHDIDETLVHPDLELFPGFLVHVRGAEHGVDGPLRGQRDRSRRPRAGPLGRAYDLARRLVEDRVVVRPKADADALAGSGPGHYSVTSATTP